MNELQPGIYYDMPWEEYVSIPYPSPSLLKHGLRSPLRLKRAMDGECKPSEKTVAVGQTVHCMVSDEFEKRIAVMPSFETDPENLTKGTEKKPPKTMHKKDGSLSVAGEKWQELCRKHNLPITHDGPIFDNREHTTSKNTEYYETKVAEFTEANQGKTIINDVQMNVALKCYKQIRRNKAATELFQKSTMEVCVIAEIDGLMTKTRMDGIIPIEHRGWDLKTMPDIEPRTLYRHARSMGYFFQFAFHSLALENAGNQAFSLQHYDIIAAEVQDDFDVGVVEINNNSWDLIDQWREKVLRTIDMYKHGLAQNHWPGLYPLDTDVISIPEWDMAATATFEG